VRVVWWLTGTESGSEQKEVGVESGRSWFGGASLTVDRDPTRPLAGWSSGCWFRAAIFGRNASGDCCTGLDLVRGSLGLQLEPGTREGSFLLGHSVDSSSPRRPGQIGPGLSRELGP
jgi:hypothetical protein